MSDILRMFAPRTSALAFSLPEFIFSGPAILIYILIIVAAVTLLVFALAIGDSKDKKETTITIESAELRQRICAAFGMLFSKAEGKPSRRHINLPL